MNSSKIIFVIFIFVIRSCRCELEDDSFINETLPLNISAIIHDFDDLAALVGKFAKKFLQETDSTCAKDVMKIVAATGLEEQWALQYFDSFGKLPAALFKMNINWLGSYRECRDVKATYEIKQGKLHTFNGQFCYLTVPNIGALVSTNPLAEKFPLRYGYCLPDSCEANIAAKFVSFIGDELPTEYKYLANATTYQCHPNEVTWEWRGIFGLTLLGIFILIITLATAYDVIVVRGIFSFLITTHGPYNKFKNINLDYTAKNTDEENGEAGAADGESKSENIQEPTVVKDPPKGVIADLSQAFSVYTNALKIINTDGQSEGTLTSIHGIRFLSMTWVILGHTYGYSFNYTSNKAFFFDLINRAFQVVTTAGTYSVDSFFLISGTLVTYLFLRQAKKAGGLKKISWIQFYVHRFWRLTPPYMLILCLYVCLTPYMSSGPMWNSKGIENDYCTNTWWKNILYINNLFQHNTTCMGWSWYLANDMQFYILSPLFLIPFALYPIGGFAVIAALLLASWIATGIILGSGENVVTSKTTGMWSDMLDTRFFDVYYVKPWTRIGPYLIGALLGYILYKTECKLKMPKVVVAVGWALAIAMNLSLVYGLYKANANEDTIKVLYTLGRSAWGVGLAWVILCCCTGYGGIVNDILSWKALIPVSRLTYCAYLVHPWIMYIFYSSRQTLLEPTQTVFVIYYLGYVMLAYMTAFVLSLLFEAPMIGLEKTILKSRKNK